MAGPSRIAQIALPVKDLARATAFYRDVVGLPLMFEVPNLAFFNLAGTRLMLGVAEGEDDSGASVIYYAADDVRAEHERIVARGATPVQAPHLVARLGPSEVWIGFYRDSEGNTFALTTEYPAESGSGAPASAAAR